MNFGRLSPPEFRSAPPLFLDRFVQILIDGCLSDFAHSFRIFSLLMIFRYHSSIEFPVWFQMWFLLGRNQEVSGLFPATEASTPSSWRYGFFYTEAWFPEVILSRMWFRSGIRRNFRRYFVFIFISYAFCRCLQLLNRDLFLASKTLKIRILFDCCVCHHTWRSVTDSSVYLRFWLFRGVRIIAILFCIEWQLTVVHSAFGFLYLRTVMANHLIYGILVGTVLSERTLSFCMLWWLSSHVTLYISPSLGSFSYLTNYNLIIGLKIH